MTATTAFLLLTAFVIGILLGVTLGLWASAGQ